VKLPLYVSDQKSLRPIGSTARALGLEMLEEMIRVQFGEEGGQEKIAGELRDESVQKILLEQGSMAMPVGLLPFLVRNTSSWEPSFASTRINEPSVLLVR